MTQSLVSDSTLKTAKLPNGETVFCLKPAEVKGVYEDQVGDYFKYGIKIESGDVILDVGANIGLFSLWCYYEYSDVEIYAFEPIPEIYAALDANIKRLEHSRIKGFMMGLSREVGTATFDFHPYSPTLSTAYSASEDKEDVKQSVLRNFRDAPPYIRRLRFVPAPLRGIIIDRVFSKSLQTRQVTCQLSTLSRVIAEQGLTTINLLKIDVEKAELDVLMGLEEQDWPKVQQFVAEVHDIDGRLSWVKAMLKEKGFTRIEVDQEVIFRGSRIHNVYATRWQSSPAVGASDG